MKQDRYVIFPNTNLELETYIGANKYDQCTELFVLGKTPEQIAANLKLLGIGYNGSEVFYSSCMEFGTEDGFATDEAPIELFEAAWRINNAS